MLRSLAPSSSGQDSAFSLRLRGFEFHQGHQSGVAQRLEQRPLKPFVVGSSPSSRTAHCFAHCFAHCRSGVEQTSAVARKVLDTCAARAMVQNHEDPKQAESYRDSFGLIKIGERTCCLVLPGVRHGVPCGTSEGDLMVFVEPGCVMPDNGSLYPMFLERGPHRVGVRRVYGVVCDGLLISPARDMCEGDDVTERLGIISEHKEHT